MSVVESGEGCESRVKNQHSGYAFAGDQSLVFFISPIEDDYAVMTRPPVTPFIIWIGILRSKNFAGRARG